MTAYSQTTNIQGLDKKQKQEIASTLLAYPILMDEYDTLLKLNASQEQIIQFLKQNISKNEQLIFNKDLEISNLIKQKKLYEKLSNPSALFAYFQTNLNGFNNYGLGIDYVIKNKLIIGTSVNYDNIHGTGTLNAKIGFKLK